MRTPPPRSQPRHWWQLVVILPLLTIVPVLVMSSLAVSYSEEAVRRQVLQPNRSAAQAVAASIGRYIKTELSRVEMMARDPRVVAAAREGNSPVLWQELDQAYRHSQELEAWTLTDEEGILIANYPRDPSRLGRNLQQRNWYAGIRDGGWQRPFVSAIYQKLSPAALSRLGGGKEKPVWVIALAAPIRDGDRPVGLVLANLTLREIASWVRPVQASSRAGYGFVVDQKGHLVYYPDVNPDAYSSQTDDKLTGVPAELNYADVSIVKALREGRPVPDGKEVADDPRHRGDPQLAWAVPVPGTGWHVIVQQSQAAAMAPVRGLSDRLRTGSAVVVILALLLAGGAGLLERRLQTLERRLIDSRHEYELAVERAQRDADMAIGQEIQRSLLRKEVVRGIEIECHSDPAQLVGGDFYSVFPVDARRQGIVIGDVSGKGVKAALYMSVATTLIQTLAQRGLSPARVLEAANADLVPTMHRLRMFVTALYGVLDLETGDLTFANAGHPPPMLRRPGTVEEVELFGVPLGAMADAEYEELSIRLAPGDALIFYSDGYIEARDERREMLGFDGLRAILERSRADTAAALITDLLEAWRTALAGRDAEDDLTLVVVRSAPEVPRPHRPTGELAEVGRG